MAVDLAAKLARPVIKKLGKPTDIAPAAGVAEVLALLAEDYQEVKIFDDGAAGGVIRPAAWVVAADCAAPPCVGGRFGCDGRVWRVVDVQDGGDLTKLYLVKA